MFEQFITVNKNQIGDKITELPEYLKEKAEEKIKGFSNILYKYTNRKETNYYNINHAIWFERR